jgi:hypothetical protein
MRAGAPSVRQLTLINPRFKGRSVVFRTAFFRLAGIVTLTLVTSVAAALAFAGSQNHGAAAASGRVSAAPVPAVARAFRFEAEKGTSTRVIMSAFNVLIAAGCDSEGDGRLKVKMRLTAPGQLQSASVSTSDKNADAINEITGIYQRKPRAINILSSKTDNQIGHTEVITGTGGVVSIHWQADNPSRSYDRELPGESVQHRCLFAGTAIAAP